MTTSNNICSQYFSLNLIVCSISENSRKLYVADLANDVHRNFPPEALTNTVSSYETAYWLERISYNFLIWRDSVILGDRNKTSWQHQILSQVSTLLSGCDFILLRAIIMSHNFDLTNKPICCERDGLRIFEVKMSNEPFVSHCDILYEYHWRIQGGAASMCPLRVEILSFQHTNFTKRSRLGSWCPPYEVGAPLREILDPPLNMKCHSGSFSSGGSRGCHQHATPLRVQIILFWHTNFSKRSRLGSWHPPMRLAPPLREILDPRLFSIHFWRQYVSLFAWIAAVIVRIVDFR